MDLNLEQAIAELKAGHVIGVPTDTVYGLSSLIDYGQEIYRVKNRDRSKKLVTMVSDEQILNVTDPILIDKMKSSWPGAVTLIFDYEGEMRSFRIPDEPNLLALLKQLDQPIYTTSANISGYEPCLTREEFKQTFPNVGLLNEDIESVKSTIPSEIYIYNKEKFERIR